MKAAPPQAPSVLSGVLHLLVVLGVLVAIGYFLRHGGNFGQQAPRHGQMVDDHLNSTQAAEFCGRASDAGRAIPIEMVYSDDKRPWMEFATNRFSRLCPNVQVKLTALADIDAANAIFSGQVKPTVWSPTDELSLRYLEHRFSQDGAPVPFQIADRRELVQSPLVVLIWQERQRVLKRILEQEPSPEGQWMRALCPLIAREPELKGVPIEHMRPGAWGTWFAAAQGGGAASTEGEPLPTLDEIRRWGQVKIGHSIPTRDSAGLGALFLMSYDYLLPPAERARGTFEAAFASRKAALQRWLRRCEAGLDAPARNARTLTDALFDLGPALHDGVITYEHLALPYLDRVEANAGALRKLVIYYPEPMLLARHPAVLFADRPERQEVASRWLRFLVSPPMQEAAIRWGFRPVNPQVTLRGYNVEQNRFLRLRRYGVLIQPSFVEAPRISGRLVQELIAAWADVTGRN